MNLSRTVSAVLAAAWTIFVALLVTIIGLALMAQSTPRP